MGTVVFAVQKEMLVTLVLKGFVVQPICSGSVFVLCIFHLKPYTTNYQ